jgi:hypothetical protein
MRWVERVCDRCLEGIPDGGSVIEVSAGELRRALERVDLCDRCSGELLGFVRTRQGTPGRAIDAEDDGSHVPA